MDSILQSSLSLEEGLGFCRFSLPLSQVGTKPGERGCGSGQPVGPDPQFQPYLYVPQEPSVTLDHCPHLLWDHRCT